MQSVVWDIKAISQRPNTRVWYEFAITSWLLILCDLTYH